MLRLRYAIQAWQVPLLVSRTFPEESTNSLSTPRMHGDAPVAEGEARDLGLSQSAVLRTRRQGMRAGEVDSDPAGLERSELIVLKRFSRSAVESSPVCVGDKRSRIGLQAVALSRGLEPEAGMTIESLHLATSLARVATEWESVSGLDATLARITEGVQQTIPDVAFASISTRGPKGELKTLAPTDVIASRADQFQYEAGEGPCYEVVTTSTTLVATEDLATDSRWPSYAPLAGSLGLKSQLAVRIYTDSRSRAGLNLYSPTRGMFDAPRRNLVELFAAHAAIAMGHATALEQLNQAVFSHKVIGPAIGILMERYQINENAAFEFLIRTSQNSNTKLRSVASEIVSDSTRSSERTRGDGVSEAARRRSP